MKKILLIPLLILAFMIFPGQSKADNTSSNLSQDTIEDIVDKVLELDEAGKTKAEIVDAVQDLLDTDEDDEEDDEDEDEDGDDEDDSKSNKGKSSIKKINFGQFKKLAKSGDNGDTIKDLQEALNKIASDLGLTFNILLVDGKFGSNTVKVVKMIQAHQQILADGVVGPVTLAKLNKLLDAVEVVNSAPEITLTGDAAMTVAVDAVYVDAGATASDAEDGDITSSIVVGGDIVDTSVAGVYTISYDVSDSKGLAATQVERVVTVE